MGIKLVIFDFDGTIADTLPDIVASVNIFLEKYGDKRAGEALIRRSIGNGARKLIERTMAGLDIPGELSEEELSRYKKIYSENGTRYSKAYPCTTDTLKDIKRRGIHIAMATMKPQAVTKKALAAIGADCYFDLVFSAEQMEKPKPDPWVVRACAERFGVSTAETMMVGDGMTDVRAGRDAGAVAVAVLGGYYDTESLLRSDADYKIESIGELPGILDKENGKCLK